MRINKAVEDKSRDSGLHIYIESEAVHHAGDLFSIDYEGKPRYFKAEKVIAHNKEILLIKAKEYGYYNKIFGHVDIRKLIDMEVSHITDPEIFSRLHKEACYC
jgi:hypothetical protein